MTNRVISFFEKVEGVFKKLFGSKATWEQTAIVTIKYVAPLVDTIVTLVAGQAVGSVVTNIINEIKADLATVYTVAQDGAVADGTPAAQSVIAALNSINENMGLLLAAAEVKNSSKVVEIEETASIITGGTNALLSNLTTAPATVQS